MLEEVVKEQVGISAAASYLNWAQTSKTQIVSAFNHTWTQIGIKANETWTSETVQNFKANESLNAIISQLRERIPQQLVDWKDQGVAKFFELKSSTENAEWFKKGTETMYAYDWLLPIGLGSAAGYKSVSTLKNFLNGNKTHTFKDLTWTLGLASAALVTSQSEEDFLHTGIAFGTAVASTLVSNFIFKRAHQ
jgi:hypothetical protein